MESNIYRNAAAFGVDQEAYITLTTISLSSAEIGLSLKSQSGSLSSGLIDVFYNPAGQLVQVWTYQASQGWIQHRTNIPVTLVNGNQFGVRAKANGQVEVYKNGILVGSRDVSAWPYYAQGGYIGLFGYDAGNTVFDNFGGGSVGTSPTATPTNVPTNTVIPPTSTPTKTPLPPTNTPTTTAVPLTVTPTKTPLPPTSTPTKTPLPPTATPSATATMTPQAGFPITAVLDSFNRANGLVGSSWSGSTTGFRIEANQLRHIGSGEQDIYRNSASYGADQEVHVILAAIDPNGTEIGLVLKSQRSSTYNLGLIEVAYSPVQNQIQIWTFQPSQGWITRGTPLAVTFAAGDQFGAHAKANGQVEVYKNGSLLGARSVIAWPYYAHSGYIGLFTYGAGNTVFDNFGGGTGSN